MRRVFFPLLLVALLLTACGGSPPDLAPVSPPNSTAVEQTGNAQIDSILSSWREQVPPEMANHYIRADTIQQNVYTANSTLEDVQKYYVDTFNGQNGWHKSLRSPGLNADQGVAIDTYEHGTTSLVIGAIDATRFGGQGVVVYTATGHR